MPGFDSVHVMVRLAEQNFIRSTTVMGRYVRWSMHDVLETIDAYLNSKHTSGLTDSLNREKPFFNIVSAAVNIWYRATKIDRKDIRFVPTNAASVILAFLANVFLQKWMVENEFGTFLTEWGRALARYGSTVIKVVEQDGTLKIAVVPWNRIIADPIEFDSLPRIEKFYRTPAQLIEMATPGHPNYANYNMEAVRGLLRARVNRMTIDKQNKDNQPQFVELYEVHGLMDSRLLDRDPRDSNDLPEEAMYSQQMHVISYYSSANGVDEWDDYTLYKGLEKIDPEMITHLIKEDGRTLSIGAVEYLFDAQWMVNHTMKNMKDTLDLASRLIFQTADSMFAGRNVLSAIETGDILIHQVGNGMELQRIANDKPDIQAAQNFLKTWQSLASDLTSTPESLRGGNLPSGTPYSLAAFQGGEANSLFEVMTENKGLALEKILRTYIIPHLKKKMRHSKELAAILDDAGVKEIDAYYIPYQAIKNFNEKTINEMLDKASQVPSGNMPEPLQPFNQQNEQAKVGQQLAPLGNKRFFKPDEIGKKTWAALLSDFEWDSIRIEVTNENVDKKAVLSTLSAVLQTVASNPMILQDPNAKMLFSKILTETGVISPLELTAAPISSPAQPTAQPNSGQPTPGMPVNSPTPQLPAATAAG